METPRELNQWTEATTKQLVARFANDGVVRVEYVVGFVKPFHVSIWLGTETDAQKRRLAARPGLRRMVLELVSGIVLDLSEYEFRDVVVESEETVRRDYEGSWFYALR